MQKRERDLANEIIRMLKANLTKDISQNMIKTNQLSTKHISNDV